MRRSEKEKKIWLDLDVLLSGLPSFCGLQASFPSSHVMWFSPAAAAAATEQTHALICLNRGTSLSLLVSVCVYVSGIDSRKLLEGMTLRLCHCLLPLNSPMYFKWPFLSYSPMIFNRASLEGFRKKRNRPIIVLRHQEFTTTPRNGLSAPIDYCARK